MRLRVEQQGGCRSALAALEPGSCRALRVDPAVRDWHVHQQEVAKEEEGKTKSLFPR